MSTQFTWPTALLALLGSILVVGAFLVGAIYGFMVTTGNAVGNDAFGFGILLAGAMGFALLILAWVNTIDYT